MPDTKENRDLILGVANDPTTIRGVDKYGNEWREKILPNGEQVWVQIRGHNVWNAGKKYYSSHI